jgi:hypothetical protein
MPCARPKDEEILLMLLRSGIDGCDCRRLGLGRGNRIHVGVALRTDGFPLPGAQLSFISLASCGAAAGGASVGAFSVEAHRGGHHELVDPVFRSRDDIEEEARPATVRVDVVVRLVHRLPDSDSGGEVDDSIRGVQGLDERHAVGDVAVYEANSSILHMAREMTGLTGIRAVDLGIQVVENRHRQPAADQAIHQVGADETRPAGDEDSHCGSPSGWRV